METSVLICFLVSWALVLTLILVLSLIWVEYPLGFIQIKAQFQKLGDKALNKIHCVFFYKDEIDLIDKD